MSTPTPPPDEELHATAVEPAPFRSLWRRQSKSRPQTTTSSSSVDVAVDGPRPRLTEDERAEKHRMIVRRSYYQKKELKARLRDEITKLEAQYQQLVGESTQLQLVHGHQHSHGIPPSASSDPHCGTCAQLDHLRRQYRELSVTKEALQKEKEALEDSMHEHGTFQDKVDQLADRELARQDSSGLVVVPTTANTAMDQAITMHTPEFQVSFEPLTQHECSGIIHTALAQAKSQTSSSGFFDVGPHLIMGWNRKRTFGTPPNKFSLLKTFTTQSAVTLCDRTWRLYTEGRLFEQLYSGTVNMKFHVLQRVSDHAVLFARTLKTERLKVRNLTFFLLARVADGERHLLLFQSIDKQRIHAVDHPDDAVLSMSSWLCFTDRRVDGGEACDLEFGGVLPSASVADTDFWMMEFVSYLQRLETRAIGPVFQVLQ